ncbi:polyadenylate-binding protein-interacting protein 2B-like isoform X2 [Penaeus japonicus]|uniref:polyadenylate-binding protein-interacting protein 2B-like isoform X2 n=1 Tax=Penaeus japonicus TaxID=27405 RepID=UPI001C71719F|nr:polyadenylate-binding protein-interacting protein 2B-like isoform X2 [Penaeus japonicus]
MRLPSNNPSGSQSSGGFGSARMNSNAEPDFSEFMWMAEEDLEAFDNKVITEVAQVMMQHSAANNLRDEEEEFLRQMLEEEERSRNNTTSDLTASMQKMGMKEDVVANSNLNPYAAEFVPGQAITSPANAPSLVHKKNTEKSS